VNPLLGGDETGAIHPLALALHEGDGQRLFIDRIFGAIFIARQVQSRTVAKSVYDLHQGEGGGQQFSDAPGSLQDVPAIIAAQPAPHRRGRGRNIDAGIDDGGEGAQAFDAGVQFLRHRQPQPDHGF